MDTSSSRRTVIFVLVVSAALLLTVVQSGILVLMGKAIPIEGDVVSIAQGSGDEREATIRLKWGWVVKASVPAACVVFPDQVATINFTGPVIGSEPGFRVWESREKQ
jgi:hypothetical protein